MHSAILLPGDNIAPRLFGVPSKKKKSNLKNDDLNIGTLLVLG